MMVMVLRVALAASDGQQKNQLLPLAQILPVMALPRWGPRDLAQPQFPHLVTERDGLRDLWESFQL